MIKNYFKTAFRSLLKNKGFTAINVFGLTLGIATCLLIVFYVLDELSYDRFNEKADRIYRVNNDIKFGGSESFFATAPGPAAMALKADFPEIAQAARIFAGGTECTCQEGRQVRAGRPGPLCRLHAIFHFFLPHDPGQPRDCARSARLHGDR